MNRPRARSRSPSLLFLLLLLPGCSHPTDAASTDPGAAGRAAFALVGARPADRAAGVPLGAGATLLFSDFPDPASLSPFGAITIRSGLQSRDYEARVDLIDRAVTVVPAAPLQPFVQYEVIASRLLTSIGGVGLGAPAVTRFTTSDVPGGAPPAPVPRTLAGDIQPLLDATCLAGCHDAATRAEGLILDAAHAPAALAAIATRSPLPRVRPYDPARSYLLRKMLGTPDAAGERMPPGAPWSDADLRALSDWIATGAQ